MGTALLPMGKRSRVKAQGGRKSKAARQELEPEQEELEPAEAESEREVEPLEVSESVTGLASFTRALKGMTLEDAAGVVRAIMAHDRHPQSNAHFLAALIARPELASLLTPATATPAPAVPQTSYRKVDMASLRAQLALKPTDFISVGMEIDLLTLWKDLRANLESQNLNGRIRGADGQSGHA